jgi:maleylacetoacetate isomerase
MAILEWLEETQPAPALLPRSARDRAWVRAIAQVLIADVQPLQNQSVTRYLKASFHADEPALQTWLREWIGRGLATVEALLGQKRSGGKYCHGDQPTFADVCLVPQCASARRFGIDLADYPSIALIDQHCTSLLAFERAAPVQQPDAPQ